jgi:hypothetical protein
MPAPDDFVKKITDQLKEANKQAQLETERKVQEANTIKSTAPEQWAALRVWVKRFCEDANGEMESPVFNVRDTPSKLLIVDAKTAVHGTRMLQAEFHENTNAITSSSGRIEFKPFIDGEGFGFSYGSNRVSVEEMGQALIKSLLELRAK